MKLKEVLEQAITKLKENNIEEWANKARRLLAFTLKVSKEYLIINDEVEIPENKIREYNENIEQLIDGKPIQYIIGKQEFMGIDFIVNENVLIPQPDTEILVEETIKLAKAIKNPQILDLCTGSGAIAVSIAKYVPNSKISASDISKKALEIAKINDRENKVKFIYSNLFENIKDKFDIIVSNPPYIKTEEIKTLSKEVQNEPMLALDGGQDGLYFYRKIIDQAHKYLNENGYLCLEIGEDQKEEVVDLIKQNGYYENVQCYKDLSGNNRVVICKIMHKIFSESI